MRVALIDDHDVVAVALESAIAASDRLEFAGTAPDVDALLATMPDTDLVVLDLRLADGSSPINNVERLTEGGMRVIVFTSGENPYLVRLAARTPVLGIVRKSAPLATLVETLERAADDEPSMSTEWASAIDTDPSLEEAKLSPQEQQVLALFARGAKLQAVASDLSISPATVEDYVRRIRTKYARIGRPAHTKVDLYKRAIEDGILPVPDAADPDHRTP
jgi:two-component system, NarL family, response regulator DevR